MCIFWCMCFYMYESDGNVDVNFEMCDINRNILMICSVFNFDCV